MADQPVELIEAIESDPLTGSMLVVADDLQFHHQHHLMALDT